MYILYTCESIIAGPNQEDMVAVVADLKKENLGVNVEGPLENFLVVNINRITDGRIHLTQPHLIEQIVKDLVQENPKTPSKLTPAQTSKILN